MPIELLPRHWGILGLANFPPVSVASISVSVDLPAARTWPLLVGLMDSTDFKNRTGFGFLQNPVSEILSLVP
jgi:hypothetical protein